MTYKTYITEAIVCGAEDRHGADRSFLLFTRDAGMLHASAKSVRREESKHRYALQECSHARVTLVRGKSGWRVTGAEAIQNFYARGESRAARLLLRNIILLLRRTIRGESAHPDVFDDIVTACERSVLHDAAKLEQLLSLRILHALGYIPPHTDYAAFLDGTFPFSKLDTYGEREEEASTTAIERALRESQL